MHKFIQSIVFGVMVIYSLVGVSGITQESVASISMVYDRGDFSEMLVIIYTRLYGVTNQKTT